MRGTDKLFPIFYFAKPDVERESEISIAHRRCAKVSKKHVYLSARELQGHIPSTNVSRCVMLLNAQLFHKSHIMPRYTVILQKEEI